MLAHLLHLTGKLPYGREHRRLLQVAQNVMAVLNCLELVQRSIEQRREVILLPPRGQRGDDLVQMQVCEEVRRLERVIDNALVALEQNAMERRRRDCAAVS